MLITRAFLEPINLRLPERQWLPVDARLDFGAARCFTEASFVKQNQSPVQIKEDPTLVEAIDGRLLRSGLHYCPSQRSSAFLNNTLTLPMSSRKEGLPSFLRIDHMIVPSTWYPGHLALIE
ncbi:UNVERIFIED_CONTAM: hypothetical protein K2H54_035681 [Gekko kuhli]